MVAVTWHPSLNGIKVPSRGQVFVKVELYCDAEPSQPVIAAPTLDAPRGYILVTAGSGSELIGTGLLSAGLSNFPRGEDFSPHCVRGRFRGSCRRNAS